MKTILTFEADWPIDLPGYTQWASAS